MILWKIILYILAPAPYLAGLFSTAAVAILLFFYAGSRDCLLLVLDIISPVKDAERVKKTLASVKCPECGHGPFLKGLRYTLSRGVKTRTTVEAKCPKCGAIAQAVIGKDNIPKGH